MIQDANKEIVEEVETEYLYFDEEIDEQVLQQVSTEDKLVNNSDTINNKAKNRKTKLVQDMIVRWNSTLAMLTRLVEFSPYIR